MNKPNLFIFAGINDAGKSTFTKETQIDNYLNVVNLDIITKELIGRSFDLPTGIVVQAGSIALEQRNQFIHKQKNFWIRKCRAYNQTRCNESRKRWA